jgi:hypothetical protein
MALYKFSFTNGRDHGEDTGATITFSLPVVGVRARGEDPVKLAEELSKHIHSKGVVQDFYQDLLRIKILVGELCKEFGPVEVKLKDGSKAD